jgi:hypothetical protein
LLAYKPLLQDPERAAAVRIARALYLRFLLSSAPARLQPWCDGEDLAHMPRSHMFEWISHDFERVELAALEDAMTSSEAALYARSLEGVDHRRPVEEGEEGAATSASTKAGEPAAARGAACRVHAAGAGLHARHAPHFHLERMRDAAGVLFAAQGAPAPFGGQGRETARVQVVCVSPWAESSMQASACL